MVTRDKSFYESFYATFHTRINCDNAVEPTPKAPTKRSRSESGHASGSSLAYFLPLALVSQSLGGHTEHLADEDQ